MLIPIWSTCQAAMCPYTRPSSSTVSGVAELNFGLSNHSFGGTTGIAPAIIPQATSAEASRGFTPSTYTPSGIFTSSSSPLISSASWIEHSWKAGFGTKVTAMTRAFLIFILPLSTLVSDPSLASGTSSSPSN